MHGIPRSLGWVSQPEVRGGMFDVSAQLSVLAPFFPSASEVSLSSLRLPPSPPIRSSHRPLVLDWQDGGLESESRAKTQVSGQAPIPQIFQLRACVCHTRCACVTGSDPSVGLSKGSWQCRKKGDQPFTKCAVYSSWLLLSCSCFDKIRACVCVSVCLDVSRK